MVTIATERADHVITEWLAGDPGTDVENPAGPVFTDYAEYEIVMTGGGGGGPYTPTTWTGQCGLCTGSGGIHCY